MEHNRTQVLCHSLLKHPNDVIQLNRNVEESTFNPCDGSTYGNQYSMVNLDEVNVISREIQMDSTWNSNRFEYVLPCP